MNRTQLVEHIAHELEMQKQVVDRVVAAVFEKITHELAQDGSVVIAGFGQFLSRMRKGRVGVDPRDPTKPMDMPSVRVAKFKPGKRLKDTLKGKRAIER